MSTASSIHSSDRFSQRDLQQQQGDGWKVAQQSDRCSVKSVPTKTSPTSPTTAYYTNAPLPLRYSPTPKLVPSAPRSLSPSPLLTPKNNRHLDPLAHRHHTQAQSRYGEQPKPQPQPQLQASANLLHHQSSVPSASSSAPYQPYNHALSYHYEEASEEEPKKYQLSDPPASSLSYSSPTTIDHSASSSPVPSIADMSTHTNATSTNDSASKSIHSVPVHTNNADKLIFYNEIYESRRPYSHYFGTPGHDSHQRYLMNNSSSSSSKKSGNKKSTKNGKRYSSNEQNHYQVYNNSKKKSVGLFTKLMKSLKHRFISG
ncbi:hypothetical protein BDF20DRAFT_874292 [Mycotypha africana]|uniref:uncharacterized protein n=1 Tax=Mycotypha africana TaxID=64632 RepID=UPI00230042BA|nr:uncharacterized protein BDF20DRAFT_874292 [Mycotypha africana]KAI8977347.1 hypothetical protein BDF20DRAFT_874292 [Mycotypha africana]